MQYPGFYIGEQMKDPIEKGLTFIVIISFTALMLTVLMQVFTRVFTPEWSQIWTEEVTRFLFIYSITMAAPLAMKRKMYVNIELINYLPAKIQIVVHILIQLAITTLFLILMIYGFEFTRIGMTQTAPTIKIPISFIFVTIPVMGAFMVLYTIYNLYLYIKSVKNGGGSLQWS